MHTITVFLTISSIISITTSLLKIILYNKDNIFNLNVSFLKELIVICLMTDVSD